MLEAFEREAERLGMTDARAIALVARGPSASAEGRGGIAMSGYTSDSQAIADLFMQVRAILRTMGKDMQVVDIPASKPEGRS